MDQPTILIVDDQKFLRMSVGALLTGRNYVVWEASGGREALDRIQRSLPDVVLLDVNMPEMTGVDVCRRIKANPATRAVGVIMLTGDAEKETVLECFESGADEYILKPYNPEQMVEKIEKILAKIHPARPEPDTSAGTPDGDDPPPSDTADSSPSLPPGIKLKKPVKSVLRI